MRKKILYLNLDAVANVPTVFADNDKFVKSFDTLLTALEIRTAFASAAILEQTDNSDVFYTVATERSIPIISLLVPIRCSITIQCY